MITICLNETCRTKLIVIIVMFYFVCLEQACKSEQRTEEIFTNDSGNDSDHISPEKSVN